MKLCKNLLDVHTNSTSCREYVPKLSDCGRSCFYVFKQTSFIVNTKCGIDYLLSGMIYCLSVTNKNETISVSCNFQFPILRPRLHQIDNTAIQLKIEKANSNLEGLSNILETSESLLTIVTATCFSTPSGKL